MPIQSSAREAAAAKSRFHSSAAGVEARSALDPAPRWREKAFFALRDFIHERFGLHFPPNKYEALRAKLNKTCRAAGLGDLAELARELLEHPDSRLLPVLAENVTTNFTHFFREEKAFRFLRNQILPTLRTAAPRFWSAAASTGEEAYTLAMILSEFLFHGNPPPEPVILGTDISGRVLRTAEAGVYPLEALVNVPEHFLRKYFVPRGAGEFAICPMIKRMVVFRRANLLGQALPLKGRFDVIFCRNVFYYFDREKQEQLGKRLYEKALPGAWLFTSVTESLRDMNVGWRHQEVGIHRKLEAV